MVEHSGPKTEGDFLHTLVLTDIASGWTECIAMPLRNQSLVVEAFSLVETKLPFAKWGIDTDDDSAFMNQTVFDHCNARGLEQTRSRAYKKNDQAWVEQKNGAIVRRLVGYGRLSGLATARKDGEIRPTNRRKTTVARYWRSRIDPFEHSSTVIEGWLIAKPSSTAGELMNRLALAVPEAYANKKQLCTLQRRIKCGVPSSSNW